MLFSRHTNAHSQRLIGTLVLDGWVATFGTVKRSRASGRHVQAVFTVTIYPPVTSVLTAYYRLHSTEDVQRD